MNAARPARRWQEAAGDPARMAEALVDEINDPATGLVIRDFLRAELADLRSELRQEMAQLRQEIGHVRQEMAQMESRLMWRMVTMLGLQIAPVGILVTILFQILR